MSESGSATPCTMLCLKTEATPSACSTAFVASAEEGSRDLLSLNPLRACSRDACNKFRSPTNAMRVARSKCRYAASAMECLSNAGIPERGSRNSNNLLICRNTQALICNVFHATSLPTSRCTVCMPMMKKKHKGGLKSKAAQDPPDYLVLVAADLSLSIALLDLPKILSKSIVSIESTTPRTLPAQHQDGGHQIREPKLQGSRTAVCACPAQDRALRRCLPCLRKEKTPWPYFLRGRPHPGSGSGQED